jgi:uncharacterized UPF0146 family protein
LNKVLFVPLNQNHVLIFNVIIKALNCKYEVLCHDKISEAEQYHTENLLKKLGANYRHFYEGIVVSPDDTIIKKIINCYKIKKQIVRLLNEIKPDIIILALDNDPIAQIFINESRKHSIKTMLVPEGLLKPYDFKERKTYYSDYFYNILRFLGIFVKYIGYGNGNSDLYLVSGKNSYDILKNAGVPEKRMIIVGQQKYDSFIDRIKDYKAPVNNPKIYLYAASTRIFQNKPEVELIKKLIESVEKNDIHLIIKLHPRAAEEPKKLYDIVNNSNTSSFEIIKEGYETFDLLKRVDAVITISSAIVLEALLMDKEFIAASYLAGRRRFNYDSYDAIHVIENESDINNIIKNSVVNKKYHKNKKSLLEDEIYKLDGQAVQRTIKIIESMV